MKINLNSMQADRLYDYLKNLPKKGLLHGKRMRRLFSALGVEALVEQMEENQERVEEWQIAARAAQKDGLSLPEKPALHAAIKPDDPAYECEVDDGDMDFILRSVESWKNEDDCPVPVAKEWQVYVPLMEELEHAQAELKAKPAADAKPVRPLRAVEEPKSQPAEAGPPS